MLQAFTKPYILLVKQSVGTCVLVHLLEYARKARCSQRESRRTVTRIVYLPRFLNASRRT